jgi:hypothetical protein
MIVIDAEVGEFAPSDVVCCGSTVANAKKRKKKKVGKMNVA